VTQISLLVLAGVAFAACYGSVIRTLAETWATSYAYSYGFAVLLVSAYVLWTKSKQLKALRPVPDYVIGIPVTLAGVAMLSAGRLGLLASIQEASLVVTLAGLVLLLYGRLAFSYVWFPLGYLLLGIPMWDTVIARLQPPSQNLSAWIASGLIHTLGIPVLREGTRLVLPNVALEVMRECSGVNQLLAIVAMALPAAYLSLKSNARRTALVCLAVVTSYLSNGVRIALVGFLAYRGLSNGDLRGMHLFEGLAVSVVGYVALFGCLSLLSKGERTDGRLESAAAQVSPKIVRRRRAVLEAVTLAVVLAVGGFRVFFQPADVRLKGDLETFPVRVGEWTLDRFAEPSGVRFPAIDDELVHAYPSPSGERRFVALDDELVRVYRNTAGQQLRLYVGYHRSQQEGKELTGEAGHALDAAATPLTVQLGSGSVELGQVQEDRPNRSRGVLYWYDFNGRVFSRMYRAKQYLVWDALTRRRTNGAVVMVEWESRDNADVELSRANAAAFAQSILPLLPNFIPS
jgi:EpsI family protein